MTEDEIKTKYERLFNKVKNMRLAYYEHKKHRGSAAYNRMEAYGREVDKLIKEEVKSRESTKQRLF